MTTFSDDVIAAVLHHMNDDHLDDNLLIAQAFADRAATSATMIGLDENGGQWTYTVNGTSQSVTVPWTKTISERPEIRYEVTMMYRRACKALGIEPRAH